MPLCIANFLVSSEWALYGILRKDVYLILPNGIGSALAFGQLFLFIIFPRKPNQVPPYVKIYRFLCCGDTDEKDIESIAVVPVDKNDQNRLSKHRWSTRVIANVTNEIDNVFNKVHLNDQFAYSSKLNEVDDTITLDSNGSPTEEIPSVIFPLTITNPEQLFAISAHLMKKLKPQETTENVSSNPSTPELIQVETDSMKSKLQRSQSAPRLNK